MERGRGLAGQDNSSDDDDSGVHSRWGFSYVQWGEFSLCGHVTVM